MRSTFLRSAIAIAFVHAFAIALAATSLGCNEDPGSNRETKPDPVAPTEHPIAYPPAPYGVNKGATIQNYEFSGYANPKKSSAALAPIRMEDFYNPHADDPDYEPADPSMDDRLFPEGSAHGAGTPKPHTLLIAIGSVWCGPCNQEAKDLLPGLHEKYKPCGGEFLYQLIEGGSPGTKATEANLKAWTQKYKVDYPSTLDDDQQLGALYAGGTFPAAAIVDTRTMKLVDVVSGVPGDDFWSALEEAIGPECVAEQ